MKKLFCLTVLCFGFVGCSSGGGVGTAEDRAKTMNASTTPSAGNPSTAPADAPPADAPPADAPKEGAETPKDPAAPAEPK